jgi:hypothetical protein
MLWLYMFDPELAVFPVIVTGTQLTELQPQADMI